MRTGLIGPLTAATFALAACGPAADSKPTSGPDAVTPSNPFFGTWELKAARIAPWWDKAGEDPAADPAFAKFAFAADTASGPPLLTCAKPSYTVDIKPLRGLFEGNLPNPIADAAALGITDASTTVLTFECAEGDKDVAIDFPMVDDDTILLGLDNVVYTFVRTGT